MKTEVLTVHVDPPLHQVINVAGEPLEEVSSFTYLGVPFTATGQTIGGINVALATVNRL